MAESAVKGPTRLDEIFEDEEAVLSLRSYLHSIGSAQYLSFCVEVELLQYTDESDYGVVHARSQHIYEKYFTPGMPSELALEDLLKLRIQAQLLRPTKRIYNEALQVVKSALEATFLPKYGRSDHFRRYVYEKNLHAHGALRKPNKLGTEPPKNKEAMFFKLFKLFSGKETQEKAIVIAPALRNRPDRSDTIAMIQDLRTQKQQILAATPPSMSQSPLSKPNSCASSPPSSPRISPRELHRVPSPPSPSLSPPTSPSMSEQHMQSSSSASSSSSNSAVRLERPNPNMLESQYFLMPPPDVEHELQYPHSREFRSPTVLSMEMTAPALPPSVSALSLLHHKGTPDHETRDSSSSIPPISHLGHLHRQAGSPISIASRVELPNKSDSESPASTDSRIGSPPRESLAVRSAPAIPKLGTSAMSVTPPLSLSAGAMPHSQHVVSPAPYFAQKQLRQPTLFSGSEPLRVSNTQATDFDRRIWKVYIEQCGVSTEEAQVCAEQLSTAGVSCSRIGSLTQPMLSAAGLKVGHALRMIKRQRDDLAASGGNYSSAQPP